MRKFSITGNHNRILGCAKQLVKARNGPLRSSSAGFDGFAGTIEIVPGEGIDVRANDQIGVKFLDSDPAQTRNLDLFLGFLDGSLNAGELFSDEETTDKPSDPGDPFGV